MNKALAVTFTFLLSFDGVLTYWAINTGDFVEQNSLMAPMAGSPAFIIYKVSTAVLAVLVVGWLASKFPRLRRVVNAGFTASILFYLVILASNLAEVFQTI